MNNKTNKELAVEVVIAMINANSRALMKCGQSEKLVPSFNSDQVINIINKIYNNLEALDKNQITITTKIEE